MKRKGLALLLALLQLPALAACGAAKPEEVKRDWEVSELNEAYREDIEKKCQDFFEKNNPAGSGMAVGIVDNGKVSFLNYGLTDKEGAAIDEHTRFEIASVTKTFTGLLLSEMVADEAFGATLNDPADKYLPFALPEKNGKKIELWHLSTHTSGLPRMPSNYQENHNPYADYTMEKLTDYFSGNVMMTGEPGEEYAYSNLGTGTLGVALVQMAGKEYNSGRGYEELLTERILAPLDMKETKIYLNEEELAAMARPHTAMGTPYPAWDFDALAACGAIRSTTWDLTQYMSAAMGQTACPENLAAAFDESCTLRFSGQNSIGLGFHVTKLRGGYTANWHDGVTGGSRSALIFCEKTGKGVVILCNSAVFVYDLAVDLLNSMN